MGVLSRKATQRMNNKIVMKAIDVIYRLHIIEGILGLKQGTFANRENIRGASKALIEAGYTDFDRKWVAEETKAFSKLYWFAVKTLKSETRAYNAITDILTRADTKSHNKSAAYTYGVSQTDPKDAVLTLNKDPEILIPRVMRKAVILATRNKFKKEKNSPIDRKRVQDMSGDGDGEITEAQFIDNAFEKSLNDMSTLNIDRRDAEIYSVHGPLFDEWIYTKKGAKYLTDFAARYGSYLGTLEDYAEAILAVILSYSPRGQKPLQQKDIAEASGFAPSYVTKKKLIFQKLLTEKLLDERTRPKSFDLYVNRQIRKVTRRADSAPKSDWTRGKFVLTVQDSGGKTVLRNRKTKNIVLVLLDASSFADPGSGVQIQKRRPSNKRGEITLNFDDGTVAKITKEDGSALPDEAAYFAHAYLS